VQSASRSARRGAIAFATLLTVALSAGCGGSTGPRFPRATVDRPDDVPGRQIHFVYAVPAGFRELDRGWDENGALVYSVDTMLAWFLRQEGHPSLRVDTYRGDPDVTYVRLPRSDFVYKRRGPQLVMSDLRRSGLRSRLKRYGVYYQGTLPRRQEDTCGLGSSGVHAFAIVFLSQTCPYDFEAARSGDYNPLAYIMAHEVLHELGFVPPCAPHATPDGHVLDSKDDLMYPVVEPGEETLDAGHDDYYRAFRPGCPDLSRSPYIGHPAHS
jgi:hypothetical protein